MTELTATHEKILACIEDGVSEDSIMRRFGFKRSDYLDACAHIHRWKSEQEAGQSMSFAPEASLRSRVYRVLVDSKAPMMACEIGASLGVAAQEVARVCRGLAADKLIERTRHVNSHLWRAV